MSPENNQELPPKLKAFEAELAALVPRAGRLDREELMYLAGRASVERRPGVVWPAAFGGMTVVAATLAVLLLLRPGVEVLQQGATAGLSSSAEPTLAEIPTSGATAGLSSSAEPVLAETPSRWSPRHWTSIRVDRCDGAGPLSNGETNYLTLRNRILAEGVDSWPVRSLGGNGRPVPPPMTREELFRELIGDNS